MDTAGEDQELAHVVVAGGTPGEWSRFGPEEWRKRLEVLRKGVSGSGTRWVTLCPARPDERAVPGAESSVARCLAGPVGAEAVDRRPGRFVARKKNAATVVVETCHDGRTRFAAVVEQIRADGCEADSLDEALLTAELVAPCPFEPDLVVVLGPPDTLPTSLVWELAYSELVFLDLGWDDLEAVHLEMAVEDFSRRHRRFGGLDS